jgi:NADPH:quinone reductase
LKAIVFDEIGSPLDVLRFHDVPIPAIGDDEVLVKMVSASINPGDFLFIQNLYPEPKKPHFPGQIAGNAGAGLIAKVGKKVSLTPGTLVAFYYYNTWAEYAAVPADWLIPLPATLPPEKASQFQNAITAWDLLRDSGVQPGQWLAVTAGNSSVATKILQFANLEKVNVLSIVRRAETGLDLKAWGAREVIELSTAEGNLPERIKEITNNKGLDAVIDCVGGPLLADLIRTLVSWDGRVVIYGGYSPLNFELHNFDILMKGVTIKPYAYRYFFTPPKKEDRKTLHEIAEVFAQPEFKVRVGGMHRLEDFKAAIEETLNQPERGKRFFSMSNGDA